MKLKHRHAELVSASSNDDASQILNQVQNDAKIKLSVWLMRLKRKKQ